MPISVDDLKMDLASLSSHKVRERRAAFRTPARAGEVDYIERVLLVFVCDGLMNERRKNATDIINKRNDNSGAI